MTEMQHGANSATIPATKAAIADPPRRYCYPLDDTTPRLFNQRPSNPSGILHGAHTKNAPADNRGVSCQMAEDDYLHFLLCVTTVLP